MVSLQLAGCLPEAAAGSRWIGSSRSPVVGRHHQFLLNTCLSPPHILLTGGHSVPAPQALAPNQ